MAELLAYSIIEGFCILFGFTLLAYHWGKSSKICINQSNSTDYSKFITFSCIGIGWLCKLCNRMLWDYINLAYVSYLDRSLWGKDQYDWYLRNSIWITQFQMILSSIKMCLLSIALLVNVRKWILILTRNKEIN